MECISIYGNSRLHVWVEIFFSDLKSQDETSFKHLSHDTQGPFFIKKIGGVLVAISLKVLEFTPQEMLLFCAH